MKLEIECRYCGFKVIKEYYSKTFTKGSSCEKCKDTNLIVRDLEKTKIDQYQGCPEFPNTNSRRMML